MSSRKTKTNPINDVVSRLAEEARKARADGPSSSLSGPRAQLSATLNQAGTLLARMDEETPPPRPSLLQAVLGLSASARPARRGWLFSRRRDEGALGAARIEKLLRATARDGERLSLEAAVAAATADDVQVQCVLPEGASDPVCEPRR